MLTINIKTKDKVGMTVAEETLEVESISKETTSYRDSDGQPGSGVILLLANDRARHIGAREDDLWYDIFVMNSNGQTVSRYVL